MNIAISILAFMLAMFVVVLVHEIGHYLVARLIIKEKNAKINMGFFGPTIFNSKRFKVTAVFFFGGYVGGFSNETKTTKLNMAIFFAAGAVFMLLLGIPVALYLNGGTLRLGDIFNFMGLFSSPSPLREDLFSVPIGYWNFTAPWLSLATPLDFFAMFLTYVRNIVSILMVFTIIPFKYPFKGHWNPGDGLWILKFIFNKVSEKDTKNATDAVNK